MRSKQFCPGGPTDDLHLLKTFLEIAPAKRCMESYPKDDNLPNGIHNHSQICAGDSSGIRDTCQVSSGMINNHLTISTDIEFIL